MSIRLSFNDPVQKPFQVESDRTDPAASQLATTVKTNEIGSKPIENQIKAAIVIQKSIRGYLARETMCRELIQQICDLEDNPAPKILFKREIEDQTLVYYFPRLMPHYAFKRVGKGKAWFLLSKQRATERLLKKQGSSHLLVPKAFSCEEYLVEERFRTRTDLRSNGHLYCSDPTLFNDVVREVTTFFSVMYVGGLLKLWNQNYLPNYSNLPLCLEDELCKRVGKVVFTNFEQVKRGRQPFCEQLDKPGFLASILSRREGLEILARIFFLHVDLIIEIAVKLKMSFDEDRLRRAAKEAEELYHRLQSR